MAKERSLTSYVDDWNNTKSPKGSEETGGDGGDYDGNVPYRWKDPQTKDWSPQAGGSTFGHSDDCKDVGMKYAGKQSDIAQGYERLPSDGEGGVLETRQPYGSFEQSLPKSNEFDTSDRSREFSKLEEGAHDGRGSDNPHPGSEQIGSRLLP